MEYEDRQVRQRKIQQELARAEEARAQGNEGMARVCSRRAAGIAIGGYLLQQGITGVGQSAYERLRSLRTLKEMSPVVLTTVDHLLMRVNEEHELPEDIDLIEETRWLIDYLLSDDEIK